MGTFTFIYEQNQPFNYGAFTKYMMTSGNVIWRDSPGVYCKRPLFRKAIEIELNVSEDVAKEVVETMIDLGMINIDSDNDVIINKHLREK